MKTIKSSSLFKEPELTSPCYGFEVRDFGDVVKLYMNVFNKEIWVDLTRDQAVELARALSTVEGAA